MDFCCFWIDAANVLLRSFWAREKVCSENVKYGIEKMPANLQNNNKLGVCPALPAFTHLSPEVVNNMLPDLGK